MGRWQLSAEVNVCQKIIIDSVSIGGAVIMMTEERFKETNYKMSYEEYKKCCCQRCMKEDCIHRDAYRRLPEIDGGLGLCPNLKGE